MFWNFIGDLTRLIFLTKKQTIQGNSGSEYLADGFAALREACWQEGKGP
jgi:hypothetical protein